MEECTLCTIELKVIDDMPISIASAIINYFMQGNETQVALIKLQETAEHIESCVKAINKSREVGVENE